MAAGLAAQRLGAESPLHFGVAPQSTAQCPSPPSRPVSFRLESLRGRAVSCALAVRLVPCATRCIRLARGTPASGSRTAGRLQVLFEPPSPKPARFQVDQPPALPMGCAEPRGGAHARRPGRFGRGHRGCFGGGSGVATRRRARSSEGQGCCARCEIRWQLQPRKCREQTARSSPAGDSDGRGAAAVAHEMTGSDYEDDFEEYDSE